MGTFWDMLLVRIVFAGVCLLASWHFRPFGLAPMWAAVAGLLFFLCIILFEMRLERASLRRLIGAAIGSILGILGAFLMTLVLAQTSLTPDTRSFLGVALLLVMAYIGLIVGALGHRQRDLFGKASVQADGEQARETGIAVAPRSEQHALTVVRPSADQVGAGMICQTLRNAARRRHDVDVSVTVVFAREGDHRPVG